MMIQLIALATLGLGLGAPVTAMDEEAKTYTNPVWGANFPDPFIVRDGKTFYAYATQITGAGFQIMESRDLVNWKHLGAVGKPTWADHQYWAPEVYKWKGKWYLFYSALDRESGRRDAAVAVGDSPKGPFKDVAKLVLGKDLHRDAGDNGAIDQTLFIEKGVPYLVYIREPGPRSINMVQLAPDLSRTVGETKVLVTVTKPIEQGILDGPTLVKRKGTYWLFYSTGWFQSSKKDASYRVWAASSKKLDGPYAKPAEPVLKGVKGVVLSPGHQCLVKLPKDEWWIAYHAWDAEGEPMYGRNKLGRTLRIDRLMWTKEGPKAIGPTTTPQPAPKVDR